MNTASPIRIHRNTLLGALMLALLPAFRATAGDPSRIDSRFASGLSERTVIHAGLPTERLLASHSFQQSKKQTPYDAVERPDQPYRPSGRLAQRRLFSVLRTAENRRQSTTFPAFPAWYPDAEKWLPDVLGRDGGGGLDAGFHHFPQGAGCVASRAPPSQQSF